MNASLDQFEGCIIGQCLGDALGFPVEGQGPEVCRDYVLNYLQKTPDKMLGRSHFPFGQYTDDSQLARELIISYTENHGFFIPELYAEKIAAIFAENRIVGRGMATHQAAENLISGISWDEAGIPPPSAGNGSAMRAAPIGLFYFDNTPKLIKAAKDQSRITHTDPRCQAGSVVIAGSVALALGEREIHPASFLYKIAELVQPIDTTLYQGLIYLREWVSLPPAEAAKQIAPFGKQPHYDALYSWSGISPFVVPSVLWSLYSFLRTPSDYMQTIATAIAVGGDVDTTAAMAGAISGTYLGIKAIPINLSKQLTDQGTWGLIDLQTLVKECYNLKIHQKNEYT
jgi:ADP-ribosylglycohydrolase